MFVCEIQVRAFELCWNHFSFERSRPIAILLFIHITGLVHYSVCTFLRTFSIFLCNFIFSLLHVGVSKNELTNWCLQKNILQWLNQWQSMLDNFAGKGNVFFEQTFPIIWCNFICSHQYQYPKLQNNDFGINNSSLFNSFFK